LLVSAADQLAWAAGPGNPAGFLECVQEAVGLEHLQLRCADVFDRLEYLERVAASWSALIKEGNVPADLLDLLARFWTRPFSEIRREVTALLAAIDAKANVWLDYLDRVNEKCPQLLSLLGQVLDSYECNLDTDPDNREPAELTVLARQFLEEYGRLSYSALRQRLLSFCLREVIRPEVMANLVVSQNVVLPENRRHKLINDWPLRHVYRACSLFWS
jgi:hypothetical protein